MSQSLVTINSKGMFGTNITVVDNTAFTLTGLEVKHKHRHNPYV